MRPATLFNTGAMSLFKTLPQNAVGRDFAIGDIHGHFSAVRVLLQKVNFNPAVDRLFSVGDLVDRGPESHLAEEWLKYPWFHAIAGNHEDMAIRWPGGVMPADNYRQNGGGWNMNRTPAQQFATAAALRELPIAMEVVTLAGRIGIVHADVPGDSWNDFKAALETGWVSDGRGAMTNDKRAFERMVDIAQWSRDRVDFADSTQVKDVAYVLVGHTPMKNFTSLGNTLYLDTGGWLLHDGRHFTLLDMNTMKVAATYAKNGLLDWS